MDGPGHLLSLKVMRVSRPGLASAWEPFYSSSPSFSAHSTASVLSLQGKEPLLGFPKTLRDLSAATEFLVLPASFGQIQLGETFSSCLSVNNEATVDVEDVHLIVEMQTATTKVKVAEFGGPQAKARLSPAGTMECVVSHEIKELGQHVLACTVAYRTPANIRPVGPTENGLQSFRKFYKFAVTNPLSVKTKVHPIRAPTALFSSVERSKLFLEVHVQNLTPEALWFERMTLEPVDGWVVVDANLTEDGKESIFLGSTALMQPQDVRQYVYVLTLTSEAAAAQGPVPSIPEPGSVTPLGRLDISWRSSFGEPARLITSTLSRRIPLPTNPPAPPLVNQTPAPALPPHLQRTGSISGSPNIPTRPMSPGSPRPSSPGPGARPQSPVYRARQPPGRPQSPAPSSATSTTQGTFVSNIPTLIAHSAPDIELALLVTCPPRVRLEHPFSINFSLALSVPSSSRPRTVRLAVQHVEMPRVAATMGAGSGAQPQPGEPFTPRLPSGLSTPTTVLPAHPAPPTRPFDQLLADKLLVASPRTTRPGDVTLPPPMPTGSLEGRSTSEVLYLGSSVIILEPVRFKALTSEEAVSRPRVTTEVKAELTYVPMRRGLGRVGGLRVLLVDDRFDGDDESERVEPTILKEWDVIGEVWVEN